MRGARLALVRPCGRASYVRTSKQSRFDHHSRFIGLRASGPAVTRVTLDGCASSQRPSKTIDPYLATPSETINRARRTTTPTTATPTKAHISCSGGRGAPRAASRRNRATGPACKTAPRRPRPPSWTRGARLARPTPRASTLAPAPAWARVVVVPRARALRGWLGRARTCTRTRQTRRAQQRRNSPGVGKLLESASLSTRTPQRGAPCAVRGVQICKRNRHDCHLRCIDRLPPRPRPRRKRTWRRFQWNRARRRSRWYRACRLASWRRAWSRLRRR